MDQNQNNNLFDNDQPANGQPNQGGTPVYQVPPAGPYTPPPPPQKSNTRTWIIVAVVVVVLLCCCCLVAAGVWAYNNGDQYMQDFNFNSLLPLVSAFI